MKDKKVVIFTCIKNKKTDPPERAQGSTRRSLEFAHCINPFKIQDKKYFKCGEQSGGKGVLSKVKNVDVTLSEDAMNVVQNLGFYNMVKLLRWKFYTESSKTESLEVMAFKDYILTLILCVFLFATKQDKLALGALADQIISMSMYSKYDDDRVLLLPYYIPFL